MVTGALDVPTEEDVKKLHEKDYTQGEIAKELGCHQSTISRIFAKLGLNANHAHDMRVKKALECQKNYNLAARIELNNKFLKKVEAVLDNTDDFKKIKDAAVVYGIAEDKRQKIEPLQPENSKSGLEEMRDALR